MGIEPLSITGGRVVKGRSEAGEEILTWTPIRMCAGLSCKLYDKCVYTKTKLSGGKCGVEKKYITGLYRSLQVVLENADSYTIQQVGMIVMPLYLQLCRFYIIEAGLSDPFLEDIRGGKTYEHPVYRSIRETIQIINTSVNKTDLRDIFKKAGLLDLGGAFRTAMSGGEDLINGNPDYYESLSQEDEPDVSPDEEE